ncbi:hypothetical protein MNBD_IGNAVI01-896 [hydrothermal vent metagenome]|uniref:Uncharacterized protein n=1 Tax=hydrothermal vent metagenome TaxID=652676 RepID=A0A3B1CQJ9_9ZZZZ
MFFRFIFYSILLYIVMKAAAVVWNYIKEIYNKENPTVSNNQKKNYTINKKDIIDADFEDITDKEDKKNKSSKE